MNLSRCIRTSNGHLWKLLGKVLLNDLSSQNVEEVCRDTQLLLDVVNLCESRMSISFILLFYLVFSKLVLCAPSFCMLGGRISWHMSVFSLWLSPSDFIQIVLLVFLELLVQTLILEMSSELEQADSTCGQTVYYFPEWFCVLPLSIIDFWYYLNIRLKTLVCQFYGVLPLSSHTSWQQCYSQSPQRYTDTQHS